MAKSPKFHKKSDVRVKPRKKHRPLPSIPEETSKGWASIGIDISLGSIAGAGYAYDAITKSMKGPAFAMSRWSPDDDYFARLLEAGNAQDFIFNLCTQLNIVLPYKDIVIAVEEPFPAHSGFTKRGNTQTLKQAAELSGAFLAGLLRGRFTNIMQISNQVWRANVAAQISEATGEDVTTYPKKWQSPELALRFNCTPKLSGKFRVQQWAQDIFEPWIAQQGGTEIPNFPPMISGKDGKKPRPEGSKAKAFQPDDRFDALAIANYGQLEAELVYGI